MKASRTYIGDGVYASFDGWAICLETNRGRADGEPDRIYLEPRMLQELNMFYANHTRKHVAEDANEQID